MAPFRCECCLNGVLRWWILQESYAGDFWQNPQRDWPFRLTAAKFFLTVGNSGPGCIRLKLSSSSPVGINRQVFPRFSKRPTA